MDFKDLWGWFKIGLAGFPKPLRLLTLLGLILIVYASIRPLTLQVILLGGAGFFIIIVSAYLILAPAYPNERRPIQLAAMIIMGFMFFLAYGVANKDQAFNCIKQILYSASNGDLEATILTDRLVAYANTPLVFTASPRESSGRGGFDCQIRNKNNWRVADGSFTIVLNAEKNSTKKLLLGDWISFKVYAGQAAMDDSKLKSASEVEALLGPPIAFVNKTVAIASSRKDDVMVAIGEMSNEELKGLISDVRKQRPGEVFQ